MCNENLNRMFYFFIEADSTDLPIEYKVVKSLKNKNNRECLLIELEKEVSAYNSKFIIIAPRHDNKSL